MSATRDMNAAHRKVHDEGECRTCRSPGPLEAAHIVSRAQCRPGPAEHPSNIVPLCTMCHRAFDTRRLSLLLDLRPDELAYGIELIGEDALMRRVQPTAELTPW